MGLHISEVEPLKGLTREETRQLAKNLLLWCAKVGDISGWLQQNDQVSMKDLREAGWVARPYGRSTPYGLTGKAADVAHATQSPRMTFNEACGQVRSLLTRLDAAPAQINAVSLRSVYLFGSTLRDRNEKETISDLDLGAVFNFSAQRGLIVFSKVLKESVDAWTPVLSGGDDRVRLMSDMRILMRDIWSPSSERPFTLMRIWRNQAQEGDDGLSAEEKKLFFRVQRETCRKHARARAVAALVAVHGAKRRGLF